MTDLDEIINQSKEVRAVKRALCVKMAVSEMPTSQICELLNVSQPFVRCPFMERTAAGL